MRRRNRIITGIVVLGCFLWLAGDSLAQGAARGDRPAQTQRSRRSQRVRMEEVRIQSPDGKVVLTLLGNAERLCYSVSLGDTAVIEPSPLVMELDGYDLSSGVAMGKVERYEIQKTYPWYGAHSVAGNRCNGAKLSLVHDLSFTSYTLEARVFDDGVALRHLIPGDENVSRVPDERSEFTIPAGSTVWYGGMGGHYETDYQKKDISAVRPGEWAGPPLTFKLPTDGGYGSITEANLVGYSGMGLECNGRRGWFVGLGHRQPLNYPFELRYGREEGKRLGRPAAISGTIITPWRVVMVGRDLNTLVNSTILPNLCPPPDPALFPQGIKTPWIKPGRAVWRYVDGGPGGLEGMKEFSRLAGELGFEHHVIEGFWSRWSTEQCKELVEYSRQRGVSVWFWKHSNQLRTEQSREEFFKMLADLGVAGAKVDFFDHEAKEVIDLYEAILRKAAEHRILVVFHGANKPTGRQRTWPNELVREAVRGMESSSLMERARHETILPFTRYLAGPADYTAMIFTARRRDTTCTHQIASAAILAAPLLTIAAQPRSMLDSSAADMIKSIPAVWDETIVLPGSEISELAAMARRKGDTWYLAVMCGPPARTMRVPLSFLDDGQYKAMLVKDDPTDGAAVKVENASAKRGDALTIEMRAGGGFIARFSRQ